MIKIHAWQVRCPDINTHQRTSSDVDDQPQWLSLINKKGDRM